jgi:FMN phosphatase YigB (HAD superfamily)
MSKISAVFFDFDGVLCTDHFYTNLLPDFPSVKQFVDDVIFGRDHKYVERCLRGDITYHEINKLISEATGLPLDGLTELFKASVRQMDINPKLIQFAQSLKLKGIKTALITGNMDIFNEITIPEKQLSAVFPVIINSYDYKMLKIDNNGELFDIGLKLVGLASYRGVWLIDDSPEHCAIFKAKGGYAYRYLGQKEFESWLKKSHFY